LLASIEVVPATYTENTTPVTITGNLSISDIDNTSIESAIVSINSNFIAGEDQLTFVDQSNITGSYDSSTGVMTLTGIASISDYQSALHSITYHNTTDTPSTLPRTISFEVNDGDLNSNILSRDISLVSVNDAPILSNIESSSVIYTENNAPVIISSSILLNDIDDAMIESAEVSISSNFIAGEDHLTFVDQLGISGTYSNSTGILTLTGSASVASYEAALRSVTYHNNSDNPSLLDRTVSYVVNDSNANSNTESRNIKVIAVNDAPVLSTIETVQVNYIENTAPVTITGTLSVSDIDYTQIESATVAINGNYNPGEDHLGYADQSNITGSFDASTGTMTLTGTASIADYQSALHSITYHNTSENPSIPIRSVSFTVNDGDYNSNTLLRDISVTPVNDAPTAMDFQISVLEGANHTFNVSELGFSDTAEGHTLAALIAQSLPTDGDLKLNGLPIDIGTAVTLADLNAGQFIYEPPINTDGNVDTAFTFSVRDDGGIASGGEDTDPGFNSVTITNQGVNDAPVINSGLTVSTLEDTAYNFKIADFGFTDGGNAVSVGAVITANQLANSQLTFTPTTNSYGSDSFTFIVQDTGGIANGGTDTALTPAELIIDVQPVNDAPVGQSSTVSMIEDTPYVLKPDQFQITDSEQHQLKEIVIATIPARGSLLLDGNPVSAADAVTSIQINNGDLVYQPLQNDTGIAQAQFSFYVRDSGGTTNGGIDTAAAFNEVVFDIVPVNDLPQGNDTTLTILEDNPLTLETSVFGFNDVENDNLSGILFATLPQNGNLEISGVTVEVNSVVSAADIDAGRLQFVPETNAHGETYAQIAFYIIDSGAGLNTSSNANVLTINVTSVNDFPTVTDSTIELMEDSIHTLSMNDFSYTDNNDAPLENTMTSITVTAVPQSGELTLDGSPVSAGSVVSRAAINAGTLQFAPAADEHAENYASFQFDVHDDGGTDNGGLNTSAAPSTITFSVAGLNDAPVAAVDAVSLNEASDVTGSVLDNDTDIDADTTLIATLTEAPVHGNLALNPDGSFAYTHDGSETGFDSFSYKVSDGELDDTAIVNITIIPVNDVPVATSSPQYTAIEQQLTTINLPTELFTDQDIGDSLVITMIGVDGGNPPAWLTFDQSNMTLNGTPPNDGEFTARLIATDNSGAVAFTDVAINVAPTEPEIAAALSSVSDNVPEQKLTSTSSTNATISSTRYATDPLIFERSVVPNITTKIQPQQSGVVQIASLEPLPSLNVELHNALTNPKRVATASNLISVENTAAPELIRLANSEWNNSVEKLGDQLDSNNKKLNETKTIVVKGTGVSATLSIGYIVWLLRGGVLLSSVLTSLPAWRMIDPLPVLNTSSDTDNTDDESLEDLVDTNEGESESEKADTDESKTPKP